LIEGLIRINVVNSIVDRYTSLSSRYPSTFKDFYLFETLIMFIPFKINYFPSFINSTECKPEEGERERWGGGAGRKSEKTAENL
jgi:hypothetical protein